MATIKHAGLHRWGIGSSAATRPSAATTAMVIGQDRHHEWAGAQALGRGRRRDGQAEHEKRAHHLCRLRHGDGQDEEEDDAEQPCAHAAGLGDVGVDGRKQQRPPHDHGHDAGDDHSDDAEQNDLARC